MTENKKISLRFKHLKYLFDEKDFSDDRYLKKIKLLKPYYKYFSVFFSFSKK